MANSNFTTRELAPRDTKRRWAVYWRGTLVCVKRTTESRVTVGSSAGPRFVVSSLTEGELVLLTPIARWLAGDPKASAPVGAS